MTPYKDLEYGKERHRYFSRRWKENNKERVKLNWKKYYQRNHERILKKRIEYGKKNRMIVLQKISGLKNPVCVYCGCDDLRFLEINHKEIGNHGSIFTRCEKLQRDVLFNRIDLKSLEVTCRVCNAHHYLKEKYGVAPFRIIFMGK